MVQTSLFRGLATQAKSQSVRYIEVSEEMTIKPQSRFRALAMVGRAKNGAETPAAVQADFK